MAVNAEQLNAEAAADGAIREAGPDTRYSPMGGHAADVLSPSLSQVPLDTGTDQEYGLD